MRALFYDHVGSSRIAARRSDASGCAGNEGLSAVILKWRRDLFKTAPVDTECDSGAFDAIYSEKLQRRRHRNAGDGRKMSRADEAAVMRDAWMEMLSKRSLILIDLPDYSRTDRRQMARDLGEIFSLWNALLSEGTEANLVVTVQKEMMGGHFFLNKMHAVEIEPLTTDQVVQLYLKTFRKADPYTSEALNALAVMSRGIFRNFLRYISMTLDSWESLPEPKGLIDLALVQRTITVDELAEDMEIELGRVFPRGSDLRIQAVRVRMLLEGSGPRKQMELVEELGMERYAMSRLLEKLELHRYIVRRRDGTDKVVSLLKT